MIGCSMSFFFFSDDVVVFGSCRSLFCVEDC